MNQTAYFDLWDIFANELIGGTWLFIFIGLIVIFIMTIKNKMPYQMSILFAILWLSIIFAHTFIEVIWVFVLLGVGTLFFYVYSRPLRRG